MELRGNGTLDRIVSKTPNFVLIEITSEITFVEERVTLQDDPSVPRTVLRRQDDGLTTL